MHYASKYNSCEAILALLELGSRLDERDYKQRTPLYAAAETGVFSYLFGSYPLGTSASLLMIMLDHLLLI